MSVRPSVEPDPFSPDTRILATYHVGGSEAEARAKAELICLDQTVEASDEVLSSELRSRIVGRLEEFKPRPSGGYEARISYAANLIGRYLSDLINLLFGTSSLRPGVRLAAWQLPDSVLSQWRGPRFGLEGLRHLTGIRDRSLVCAVLKPLGRSPRELADLATEFVLGGVDLIKDDQGLVDQPFCPFNERIARCADAVRAAAAQRGRPCPYLTHVSGPLDVMRARAALAKKQGAGGLLVAPGLTGFDALHSLAEDETLALPIASHPALLGSYTIHPDHGIVPAALYGQLPRLAGADLSIYPGYRTGYAMTKDDCAVLARTCRTAWGRVRPMAPTAAGRIGASDIPEFTSFYGRDVVFILGSRIQKDPLGLVAATRHFVRELHRCAGA
ncbi:MAG TPA: RuBisCO large subunit C-terminal-like domain-containing protein [Nitrospira sp.]|nr:RuBisCO large subunit C-terminal-like domain-containing protein [Nitrospira sp.]